MHQSRRAEHDLAPTTLDDSLLRAWTMPTDEHGDKLTRGTVLVIAGSPSTAGAALLAGTAALRMGAGRLQIATAEPVAIGLSIAVPEALVLPLPADEDDRFAARIANALSEPLASAQAVLVGPGMCGPDAIRKIVDFIAEQMSPAAVLVADAAALQAIATVNPRARRRIADHLLLTPNRGELGEVVESLGIVDTTDPLMAASQELGAVITCFGNVTSPDERRWRSNDTSPGLGTSGSGDVLAGLAAGAAARCVDPAQAACWATYVHSAAGNRLSERLGTMSFIARELVDEVPRVLAKLD
jgi:hydroxyethylthiazole kinase-like uncharacterized protein yjeF